LLYKYKLSSLWSRPENKLVWGQISLGIPLVKPEKKNLRSPDASNLYLAEVPLDHLDPPVGMIIFVSI